ncbi:hypothetical protein VP142E351_P0060 [Vibrio phage 142E35-1]|nr:hypothetical protein VP142E351_P0060 [Vibrio phage 142E35-1]
MSVAYYILYLVKLTLDELRIKSSLSLTINSERTTQ